MDLTHEKEKAENELSLLEKQIVQVEQTRQQLLLSLYKKQGQLEFIISKMSSEQNG